MPPPTFNTWFQSGSPAVNGVVNPANSVNFNPQPNCNFYQWSEQMFMWLNSPAPVSYGGGGGRIFDSPTFYDVSPLQADGTRTFIPHTPGIIRAFPLRAAQVGPHGLQLVLDTVGRILEVKPAETGATLQVRNAEGQLVQVTHAKLGRDRKPILLDQSGQPIRLQAPQIEKLEPRARMSSPVAVNRFIIDGLPIFIDPSLNVIDVETGQADDGVLMAQNGSLVYYATMVNDVYAYFATGVKDGAITATQFPTSQPELNSIESFASAHGKSSFVDAVALTIEVKSSWVETTGLANASSYVTMKATVPTFDTSNPNHWVPNGQKTVDLALVGMHIVGGVPSHPEMVWATFEHLANAPRAQYAYINNANATVTIAQNTASNWLFCKNGSAGPFNQVHMQFNSPNIDSVNGFAIGASDTIRWKAFGAASDLNPNPIDPSTAASNTEIISINNSVRGMIPSGDVRANYIFTGATWTFGGPPTPGNQVGTSMLSNTTMETYQQGQDTTAANGGSNCFSCHAGNMLGGPGSSGLSHVFGPLKPLF